ncbi:hydroxyacylglutathione hydrolase [Pseudooceanicola marinus]|uniref:hydroxyacylglutathione hydrolase n=1 Tax=Pseudooceanicola marinus TaxID=396013 RepID=UPI001CD5B054|nr:hydroxyacylglutathione hydrolase [Pseudooceanicola marinus]MCA1336515.1 hydroxyacylglutathione hydrolase [Pseudooceanicola marinus]
MALALVTIPCLSDNYAYLLHDEASGETAVIDVPEAAPILAALAERGWRCSQVWLTHHHPDHVQGLDALLADHTGARVFGAEADAHRLPKLDVALKEGDQLGLGGEHGAVLDVSGHTVGHLAFHFPGSEIAFTADSLMALGCGRVFEGTFEQMYHSLQKLAALPPRTTICSGHEYTLANGKFALTIEPDNSDLISRVEAVKAARAEGRPTVPSLLSEELATNPFLRAGQPSVAEALGLAGADPAQVFAEIRRRKDAF